MQPTYVNDGGIPAVRFNPAAPTDMDLPKPSEMGFYNSDHEFFVVVRTSSSSTQFVLSGGVNFNEIQLSGASGARFISTSGKYLDNANRVDDGGFHLINATVTGSESTLGIDGSYASYSGSGLNTQDLNMHLGTRQDGTVRLDGDIAEVIIYYRKLSGEESMQVSKYLKSKYSSPFTAYAAPGTPASGIGFSSVTRNSMNLSLTKGSGSHRIIIARKGAAVNAAPSDGVQYTGNASFGSCSEIGTGNYVV